MDTDLFFNHILIFEESGDVQQKSCHRAYGVRLTCRSSRVAYPTFGHYTVQMQAPHRINPLQGYVRRYGSLEGLPAITRGKRLTAVADCLRSREGPPK